MERTAKTSSLTAPAISMLRIVDSRRLARRNRLSLATRVPERWRWARIPRKSTNETATVRASLLIRSMVAATCWANRSRFGRPVTRSVPGSEITAELWTSAARDATSKLGSVKPASMVGGRQLGPSAAIRRLCFSTGCTGVVLAIPDPMSLRTFWLSDGGGICFGATGAIGATCTAATGATCSTAATGATEPTATTGTPAATRVADGWGSNDAINVGIRKATYPTMERCSSKTGAAAASNELAPFAAPSSVRHPSPARWAATARRRKLSSAAGSKAASHPWDRDAASVSPVAAVHRSFVARQFPRESRKNTANGENFAASNAAARSPASAQLSTRGDAASRMLTPTPRTASFSTIGVALSFRATVRPSKRVTASSFWPTVRLTNA